MHLVVERLRIPERPPIRCPGVKRSENGTTEGAYIGERVQVRQPDLQRLHASHRQPGQGSVLTVGQRAIAGVNHWNQVLDQHVAKATDPGQGTAAWWLGGPGTYRVAAL